MAFCYPKPFQKINKLHLIIGGLGVVFSKSYFPSSCLVPNNSPYFSFIGVIEACPISVELIGLIVRGMPFDVDTC